MLFSPLLHQLLVRTRHVTRIDLARVPIARSLAKCFVEESRVASGVAPGEVNDLSVLVGLRAVDHFPDDSRYCARFIKLEEDTSVPVMQPLERFSILFVPGGSLGCPTFSIT